MDLIYENMGSIYPMMRYANYGGNLPKGFGEKIGICQILFYYFDII